MIFLTMYTVASRKQSVCIASGKTTGRSVTGNGTRIAAEEYGYVAADPLNPDIVYGGKITRYDKRNGQSQNIAPEAVRSGRYRF